MKKILAFVVALLASISTATAAMVYSHVATPLTVNSTNWVDVVTTTASVSGGGDCLETLTFRPYNAGGLYELRRLSNGNQTYITSFTDGGSTFSLGVTTPIIVTITFVHGCGSGDTVKWQARMLNAFQSVKIRDVFHSFTN